MRSRTVSRRESLGPPDVASDFQVLDMVFQRIWATQESKNLEFSRDLSDLATSASWLDEVGRFAQKWGDTNKYVQILG